MPFTPISVSIMARTLFSQVLPARVANTPRLGPQLLFRCPKRVTAPFPRAQRSPLSWACTTTPERGAQGPHGGDPRAERARAELPLSGKADLVALRSLSNALVFWICVMSEEDGCLYEGGFLSIFLANGR